MIVYIGLSYPIEFKPGAFVISKWLDRPYSHTYIRFESQTIPTTVYQASHGMVNFREYEKFKLENNVIKEYKIYDITPEQRKKILIKSVTLAGDIYSKIELAQIIYIDILNKLGKDVSGYNYEGYICSELVGKFCIEDLGLKFNKPDFLLTPKDIDDALASSKYNK